MTDVFVSYAREDRERVAPLVEALEARGWSVWWDREILAGKTWDKVLGVELDRARCIVVVWSVTSIESEWVREEAAGLHSHIIKAAIDSYPFIKRADCAMFAVTLAFLSVKAWAEHEDRHRPPRE